MSEEVKPYSLAKEDLERAIEDIGGVGCCRYHHEVAKVMVTFLRSLTENTRTEGER